jgi:cytosine/uracil/thiamine/allantoin permease
MYFVLAIIVYVVGLMVASAIDPLYGTFAVGLIYYTWPVSVVCIVLIWLILRALFSKRSRPPES